MSSTLLLLLLMGIFPQLNSQEVCTDQKNLECCKKAKPLRCAYLSLQEAKSDAECACLPEAGGEVISCGVMGKQLNRLIEGSSIPCAAYYEDCVSTGTTPSCFMKYPPQPEKLSTVESAYCNFREKVGTEWVFLPETKIYEVFFTCWLYRCGNRLKIPKETKAKSEKLQWCYPPVLPQDPNQPKFCPLYDTTATDIYKAIPFNSNTEGDSNSTTTVVESGSTQTGCVLAPICNDDGSFNKTNYMVPWNNEKADEKHCERLCKKDGPNNGKISQEADKLESPDNKCRRIPSCGDETKYNRFQVPDCRPWCTSDSADYLKKSSNTCNPLPLCKDGADKPDEPYSEKNPFGWDGDCIKPTECKSGQTADTHYCTSPTDEAGGSGGPDEAGGGLLWIGLGIGLGVLVLVVIGVAVYFLVFRKKKTNDPESAATSIAPSVTSNYGEPKRDGAIVGRELKEEAKKEGSDKKEKEKKDGSTKDKKEGSTKDKKEGSSKEKKSSKEKSAKEKTSAKGDAAADKPKDNSKKSASKMP